MPAPPNGMLRLVIVDDHPAIARGVAAGLADVSPRLGHVTAVPSVAAVADLSDDGVEAPIDVVILDLQLLSLIHI